MRKYDQSIKDAVVEQVALGVPRSQVAKQVGCSVNTVNIWVAAAADTTPGAGVKDTPRLEQISTAEIIAKQAAKIRRLEKENEILEKAAAFFAAKTIK